VNQYWGLNILSSITENSFVLTGFLIAKSAPAVFKDCAKSSGMDVDKAMMIVLRNIGSYRSERITCSPLTKGMFSL